MLFMSLLIVWNNTAVQGFFIARLKGSSIGLQRHIQHIHSSGNYFDHEGSDESEGILNKLQEVYAIGDTYRRNSKQKLGDNRDYLPFTVVQADTAISNEIGTYLLEPSTSSGDFLDLGSKGLYKVNKVVFLYKFDNGRFRVYKKKLEVTNAQAPWQQENLVTFNDRISKDGIMQ